MTSSLRSSVIGIGKLGICWALSLEKIGYDVVGVELSQDYVDKVNSRTLTSDEPGVVEALKSSRLKATTNLKEGRDHADLLFVLVATPSTPDGKYDHSQIERVVTDLLALDKPETTKHLVIGCTTFPGYCEELSKRLKEHNYTVTYNPEFIAQGSILRDQQGPDMVLIGYDNEEAASLVEQAHAALAPKAAIHKLPLTSAEVCKLALNCFITTKIAYANMVGDLLRSLGQEPQPVLNAIASDSRVGSKCMKYGYGYGGPCFPRDNRALGVLANEQKVAANISEATDIANHRHTLWMIENASRKVPVGSFITFEEGVTYKPGVPILTESQQLKVALALSDLGYDVHIWESSIIIEELKRLYPGKTWRLIEK